MKKLLFIFLALVPVSLAASTALVIRRSSAASAVARCTDVETVNLTGYWKFNELAGTNVNDEATGSTHDLTLNNGPTWTSSGKCDGAVVFASSATEYGAGASPPIVGDDDDFSICAWFKSTQATWGDFYAEGSTTDADPLIEFGISGTVAGDLIFAIRDNSAAQSVDFSSGDINADDGAWHHGCLVQVNGSSRTIYMDGAWKATNTTDVSNARTVNTAQVGRLLRATAVDYFDGTVDNIRVYSSSITATQVLNIYNNEN